MLKKLLIVSALSVFMLSVFALTPKYSTAATLPGVMFTDNDKIFVSVADLGTILGTEWEIIVINNSTATAPFGFGFRNYNTTWTAAVQTIFKDDNWFGAAMAYTWIGDGTLGYLSLSNGVQSVVTLTTTPSPPAFACGVDQVQDADGNLYNTVQIGNQCWMSENLNVGTMVSGATEQADNAVVERYCYDNDSNICATDGGLYQWDEMMQYTTTEGAQGICPNGWHLPSDTEWKTLEITLGMTQEVANSAHWRGTDQGTQLKAGGTSGFQALLAGYRYTTGTFTVHGSETIFWTSTAGLSGAWYRYLRSSREDVDRSTLGVVAGFSVRCVKD